jgi:hypothetical protein
MIKDEYISIAWGTQKCRKESSLGIAFSEGFRNASDYTTEEVIELLRSENMREIYEAFGVIQKKKIRKALEQLKSIALYDEDIPVRELAAETILKIGGSKARNIISLLRTTELKDFIDETLIPNSKDK